MLKAEKCTKAAAGTAAHTCVNVSAWTMPLRQGCVAAVKTSQLKRFRKVKCYNL